MLFGESSYFIFGGGRGVSNYEIYKKIINTKHSIIIFIGIQTTISKMQSLK